MKQQTSLERRHPIFSPVAIVSTLLLAGILSLAVYLTGGRAFSPGDLSAVNRSETSLGGFFSHADFADDCHQCHAPFQGVEAGRCETCHETVAQQRQTNTGLHSRLALVEECGRCHGEHQGPDYDLSAAALVDFDHETFVLAGLHAGVACENCHMGGRFEGTPQECSACHAEPAVHRGLFGTDCAACHTEAGWLPARLPQHTFPLSHGDEGVIACATCHTAAYTEYTCYNCHEHERPDIEEEHREEGISQLEVSDCVQCHPTGQKEEGEREEDDD